METMPKIENVFKPGAGAGMAGLDGLGLGGLGGGGMLGGLILGSLLRNGGLWGGAGAGGQVEMQMLQQTLGDIKASVPLAESQTQLAITQAANDINAQTQAQGLHLRDAIAGTSAAVGTVGMQIGDKITAQTIAMLQGNTAIMQAISSDGDKTRSLITQTNEANLNRIIASQASEIAALQSEGRHRDTSNRLEINQINNQSATAMSQQAQLQTLQTIAGALAGLSQVAHATNNAVMVGGGVIGAQNANPINVRT